MQRLIRAAAMEARVGDFDCFDNFRISDNARTRSDEYIEAIEIALLIMQKVDVEGLAGPDGRVALDYLDPGEDTIPIMYLLKAQIPAVMRSPECYDELAPGQPLWTALTNFFNRCNPVEIRFDGHAWRYLVQALIETAKYTTDPEDVRLTLQYVVVAILALDPSGTVLTSAHLQLFEAAIAYGHPDVALALLQKPITKLAEYTAGPENLTDKDCPPEHYITCDSGFTDRINMSDCQLYLNLGANVYLMIQDWSNALRLFEYVLVMPSRGLVTGCMLEAFQRWTLVNLIYRGSVPELPPIIHQSVTKHLQNSSKAYGALQLAFTSGNDQKLLAEIIVGEKVWRRDGNSGLVQQLLREHQFNKVLKYRGLYSTMDVSKVADDLGKTPAETERYLEIMHKKGKLKASLSRSSNGSMVLTWDPKHDSPAAVQQMSQDQLDEHARRLETLRATLGAQDHLLGTSKELVEHEKRGRRNKAAAKGKHDALGMDTSAIPSYSEDEELMAE